MPISISNPSATIPAQSQTSRNPGSRVCRSITEGDRGSCGDDPNRKRDDRRPSKSSFGPYRTSPPPDIGLFPSLSTPLTRPAPNLFLLFLFFSFLIELRPRRQV